MSHVLAYTSPARGHLFPVTPILTELHRRGHSVSVRTLAEQVPLMRNLGFSAEAIDPRIEAIPLQDWQERGSRQALAASVRTFAARAPYDSADLSRAIADERPDAVIVDVNSWGAMAAAERWGGPWSVFCPYPLALRSADVPPFGPGLAPAHGPLGHVRDRVLRPLVLGTIRKAMLPPLNQTRRALGLDELGSADALFTRPPVLVYLTAEPFEYARTDWPANIVMVGPCDWEPETPPPSWLAQITQPLVLVTTSSEFQDDGRLVQTALSALADLPVHVVATLPSGDPSQYEVPANAHVERFVSHGPILERAVCAVTHAGMGATQKALARGVPVCAVPFGRDQFEVARRVEVARAGTRLPARRLTAERLRSKVQEAIEMKPGALRVAAGYRKAGGPVAAADALEGRLLHSSRPATSW